MFKRQTTVALLLVVLVLSLAALACGGTQSGTKVDSKSTSPTNTPGVTVYAVGDVYDPVYGPKFAGPTRMNVSAPGAFVPSYGHPVERPSRPELGFEPASGYQCPRLTAFAAATVFEDGPVFRHSKLPSAIPLPSPQRPPLAHRQ